MGIISEVIEEVVPVNLPRLLQRGPASVPPPESLLPPVRQPCGYVRIEEFWFHSPKGLLEQLKLERKIYQEGADAQTLSAEWSEL